jgi:hypothetical protein
MSELLLSWDSMKFYIFLRLTSLYINNYKGIASVKAVSGNDSYRYDMI